MISPREYEIMMALVEAVVVASDEQAWWEQAAAAALGPLLHADVIAVATVDYRADSSAAGGTFGLIRPAWAEVSVPTGSEMHRDLLADHPMTGHLRSRRAREVVRVSDLVTPSQWRGMAGHAKMRELIGATFQMGITVAAVSTHAIGFAPIRAGADFTDREVEVGRRLQAVAVLAVRHFALLAAMLPAPLSVADPRARAAEVGLTSRERIVLGLLAEGRTPGAIAGALGVSPRTVHKHQQNLYRKLGVVDRVNAVLQAGRYGLVATPAAFARFGA